MTLVDTSVWIDHFRVADSRLAALLLDGQVGCHAFVIGELACGRLQRRNEVLALLANLPQLQTLPDDHVLESIDAHRLMGRGLGWIDVHLLASAVASGVRFWSRDRRLVEAARRLGASFS